MSSREFSLNMQYLTALLQKMALIYNPSTLEERLLGDATRIVVEYLIQIKVAPLSVGG
jgi:hypothetical protein